ncbi:hypothetical protein [Salinibacter ruber]|jgi:hypothetical protein|uniref:hypothetical protein n=1 Tax=Salinibacter ruber TaxID=146919 RepID=UPI002168177A|nr:hypothetical protein [Salinibacter ruber]MCS3702954.1 hypothetical protein [Salinibacter ruber]
MNQESTREQFKERLGFEDWGNLPPGEPNVFFLHFFLTGQEFSNWELVRARRPVEEDGVTARKWFWEPATGSKENVRLHLETYECPTQTAAHEQVVTLLGHIQGPQLSRLKDGPGDVSFGFGETGASLIMARGNLVLRFFNAGEHIVTVRDLAEELDEVLRDFPSTEDENIPGPRIEKAKLEIRDAYQQLFLGAQDPVQGEEVGFRIFSTGSIGRVDSEIRYKPTAEDADRLRVFAMNQLGGISTETVEVGKE